ncbi:MAG: DUF4910 domain-containing protein [Armatimonadota bacterium]
MPDIPDLSDLLLREFSGAHAKAMTTDIWMTDRTISYDQWRKTAQYCADTMREFGLRAVRIHTYPADGKTVVGDRKMPRAWDCRGAELRLLKDDGSTELVCSYADQPLCVAQYCPRTPRRGIQAEVVVAEAGDKPSDYKGLRVRGTFVLGGANAAALATAAAKRGAVGVLSDSMPAFPPARPHAFDNPDAHVWARVEDRACVAFCLTPRQGQRLRAMVKAADAKKPVRVKAIVDSRSYAGEIWAITGVIPGHSNREIAIIPHLFEPGANDNASGCGLALELARCIERLVREKRIPPLRRSIRFLFVMEFVTTGAFYLQNPAIAERTLAAIVPDMVGNDQARCRSAMVYQTTPDAAPSFINHLMLDAFDAMQDRVLRPNAPGRDAAFKHVAAGYWGNDCFISDPNIGIPTVGMVEWPDVFYHTSADTPDNVDPDTLRRNGALVGAIALAAACAETKDVLALGPRMTLRARRALADAAGDALADIARCSDRREGQKAAREALERSRNRTRHIMLREQEALRSLSDLAQSARSRDSVRQAVEAWCARVAEDADDVANWVADVAPSIAPSGRVESAPTSAAQRRAHKAVPRRLLPGPILHQRLDERGKKRLSRIQKAGLPRNLVFWIDGRRTVAEIADRAAAETGKADVANVLRYFDLLADYGYIEWLDAPRSPATDAS